LGGLPNRLGEKTLGQLSCQGMGYGPAAGKAIPAAGAAGGAQRRRPPENPAGYRHTSDPGAGGSTGNSQAMNEGFEASVSIAEIFSLVSAHHAAPSRYLPLAARDGVSRRAVRARRIAHDAR